MALPDNFFEKDSKITSTTVTVRRDRLWKRKIEGTEVDYNTKIGNELFAVKLQLLYNFDWKDLNNSLGFDVRKDGDAPPIKYTDKICKSGPPQEEIIGEPNTYDVSVLYAAPKIINEVPIFMPFVQDTYGADIPYDPPNVTQSAATEKIIEVFDHVSNINLAGTAPDSDTTFNLINGYKREDGILSLSEYNPNVKAGFIRMQLNDVDFQHKGYNELLTKATILAASDPNLDMPNEPYNPKLKSVELEYTSEVEINLGEDIDGFYHLTPFGSKEITTINGATELNDSLLVPGYDIKDPTSARFDEEYEGQLLMGIEGLLPPQNVSLYFQFAEGTDDPDLEVPDVEWSYLRDNEWIVLDSKNILSDSTLGLVRSGVITINIPREINKGNTIVEGNLHWLRVRVIDNTSAFNDVIQILGQGAEAVYAIDENDPDRIRTAIEEDTIKKLVAKDFNIKKITQFEDSFGGRVAEQESEFYTRVSERLRHKNRAIAIRDYEMIVLEEFPEIFKVKCVNHTVGRSEIAPGNVTLVLIPFPNVKFTNDPYELKVTQGKLREVRDFILPLTNHFLQSNVKVLNPIYEKIRFDFGVEFIRGTDRKIGELNLQQDLRKIISPWAFNDLESIGFGNAVDRSVVLKLVEDLPYVSHVTSFRMYHFKTEEERLEREENGYPLEDEFNVGLAIASTATSILVTDDVHIINEADC